MKLNRVDCDGRVMFFYEPPALLKAGSYAVDPETGDITRARGKRVLASPARIEAK